MLDSHHKPIRHLLVLDKSGHQEIIELGNSTYSIGRHPHNAIVIDSKKISRRHATLVLQKNRDTGEYFYCIIDGDLEGNLSHNGVFINGEKCLKKELKNGDVISFGHEINAVYQISPFAPHSPTTESIHQRKTLLIDSPSTSEADEADSDSEVSYGFPTDFPNFKKFCQLVKDGLKTAQENHNKLAIIVLDLEDFPKINKTLGYSVGIQILQDFGQRLSSSVRAGDIVAHWEADKFTILLTEIHSGDNINKISQRIYRDIQNEYQLQGYRISLSIGMGIAVYPQDGTDVDSLLFAAEADLNHRKQQLPKTTGEKDPHLLVKKYNLLNHALEKGEFSLYYQPQFNLKTQRIEELEALLRWQHPHKGIILPHQFIPAAEETNFIITLGDWVLKSVCQQINHWQQLGFPPLPVAVNLSSRQFQNAEFPDKFKQLLQQTQIAPKLIRLEITEKIIMENEVLAKQVFSDLQRIGVHLSMDDFGTGYASLNYLQKFSFDTIKIAQTLIGKIIEQHEDIALLSAIMAWGKITNIKIVAEGVETDEQLELLRHFNCDRIQGYCMSKPLTAEKTTELLHSHFPRIT